MEATTYFPASAKPIPVKPRSNPAGKLPETGYVRQSQLLPAILPFSAATLWRKVKTRTFPAPVKLSERITAWNAADVRKYLADPAGYRSEVAL
ncbi:AlpA family phage regulatory protein [Cupriavidus sp. CV2]|uniref:helix-turn-helix transcriptional regulator n=1 Tax=Cupriavidus ulmosensis TaxID=3065913 RepID=UPI00296AF83F|nr:AlpA family phage regulatory protein [Cupriavidus sp. CV2]MDW3684004.1 AlpA family phage regulatory protein [Cupriavidus sp. CV2]